MKSSHTILMLTITLPQLAYGGECNDDDVYIAGLNTIVSEVSDMERHNPYQGLENNDHPLVVSYSGPGHPKGLVPTAKPNKRNSELAEFYFSD